MYRKGNNNKIALHVFATQTEKLAIAGVTRYCLQFLIGRLHM